MARVAKKQGETVGDRLQRYDRLVAAFKSAGLKSTQAAIAAQMEPKITQTAVSAWRRGNPSIWHLCRVVHLTGVSGHWLLLGEGPMYPRETDDASGNGAAIRAVERLIDRIPRSSLERIIAQALKKRSR